MQLVGTAQKSSSYHSLVISPDFSSRMVERLLQSWGQCTDNTIGYLIYPSVRLRDPRVRARRSLSLPQPCGFWVLVHYAPLKASNQGSM
jgi:hypothetical protein